MATTIMKNLAYLVIALFVASCGNPVLKDFNAKPISNADGTVAVEISSQFNVGGMAFDGVEIPIKHPKKGYEIGALTLNGGRVGLKINLSEIAPLQSSGGTLPNGNPLPFAGSNEVVGINVGKGVIVYASWVNDDVLIGFSIPVKPMDQLGDNLGSVSLIPKFNINNFEGAAGTYFSKEDGKNGIALFANLGGLFKKKQLQEMYMQTDRSYLVSESAGAQSLKVYGNSTSRRKEKSIARGMDALSDRRVRVKVK